MMKAEIDKYDTSHPENDDANTQANYYCVI